MNLFMTELRNLWETKKAESQRIDIETLEVERLLKNLRGTLYEYLGVEATASNDEIKRAYRYNTLTNRNSVCRESLQGFRKYSIHMMC